MPTHYFTILLDLYLGNIHRYSEAKDIVLIQKTKEVIYLNVNRYKKKESSLKEYA